MKQLLIITSFIILFSYCAISQEQNDSVSTERGYYFGLAFDHLQRRINGLDNSAPPNYYSSSFFAGWTLSLTSLHNLSKNWDIGFKFGVSSYINNYDAPPLSFLIAVYGYYYPFNNRYFFRFGLEGNKYIYFPPGGHNHPSPGRSVTVYYNENSTFMTSLSFGLGYNYNDAFLLNIGIAIPFHSEYGYQELRWSSYPPDFIPPFAGGKYPMKLYYTLSAGVAILF